MSGNPGPIPPPSPQPGRVASALSAIDTFVPPEIVQAVGGIALGFVICKQVGIALDGAIMIHAGWWFAVVVTAAIICAAWRKTP